MTKKIMTRRQRRQLFNLQKKEGVCFVPVEKVYIGNTYMPDGENIKTEQVFVSWENFWKLQESIGKQ